MSTGELHKRVCASFSLGSRGAGHRHHHLQTVSYGGGRPAPRGRGGRPGSDPTGLARRRRTRRQGGTRMSWRTRSTARGAPCGGAAPLRRGLGSCLGMGGLLMAGGDSSGRRGEWPAVPGPAVVAVTAAALQVSPVSAAPKGPAAAAAGHVVALDGVADGLPVSQSAWIGADVAVAVGGQGGRGGAGVAAVVVVGVEDDLVVAGELAEGGSGAGVADRAGDVAGTELPWPRDH